METDQMNQVLSYISKNNITQLNEKNLYRSKISWEKICVPLKNTEKN